MTAQTDCASGSSPTAPPPTPHRPYEVVGVFPYYAALQHAVDELEAEGFARCALSLAGRQQGAQAGEAAVVLADDPHARRVDHFCTEALGNAEGAVIGGFAYIPAFVSAIGGAVGGAGLLATAGLMIGTGGTGALIGVALATMISRRWRTDHRAQELNGGLLLWVGLRDPAAEDTAVAVLTRNGAHHVHSHDLP